MLFVCHPKILHKHCFQFLKLQKLKTMLMQNFGVTNKEHYGMLWYFLEWSIIFCRLLYLIAQFSALGCEWLARVEKAVLVYKLRTHYHLFLLIWQNFQLFANFAVFFSPARKPGHMCPSWNNSVALWGPVQTSNFTCAELNAYLGRPKLSSSTVDSDGRTLRVQNLIRGEQKYHPHFLK